MKVTNSTFLLVLYANTLPKVVLILASLDDVDAVVIQT